MLKIVILVVLLLFAMPRTAEAQQARARSFE